MGKKKPKKVIPKTVAGVKVPKTWRKAGDKAVKLAAEHPIVGEVLAAALLAAADALTRGGKPESAANARDGGVDRPARGRRHPPLNP
jgi:hypothetical protein